MPTVNLYTYKDAVDHLREYLGGTADENTLRDCRRAVQSAYREFADAHNWSYYYQRGQITTSAAYTTGTVAFDFTGGSSERLVTLTDGTWPTWAAYGTLVIDSVPYRVATRESSTTLTLSPRSNPGADVAAGTSYTLYRDSYPLPIDFRKAGQFVASAGSQTPFFCDADAITQALRVSTSPATPRNYAFVGDDNYQGTLAVLFWPPPDAAITYTYVYQRRPRSLRFEDYSTGTVTVTNGSAVVTGSGTTFTSDHAGSVLRVSPNATDAANGLVYETPFAAERLISTYTSATSVTCDSTFSESLSGVKYSISDPVDIDDGAMLEAFLRCCEKQGEIQRRSKASDRSYADSAYRSALIRAREADSRSLATRQAGWMQPVRSYKDMPLDLFPS